MRLCYFGKDGGPESTVWGFWPIEIKSLFSIAILKFVGDSREAFHSHAFNSISWLLWGRLFEDMLDGKLNVYIGPSIKPIITKRSTLHKVSSYETSWVLTLRGPWSDTWKEYLPDLKKWITLSSGRKIVQASDN